MALRRTSGTFARVFAAAVAFAAACGEQRLSTPTAPSAPPPAILPAEADEPAAAALDAGPFASLSIDPSVFKGGERTRGTVTLAEPAPAGGLAVTLSADDPVAIVPSSLTVAAGGTRGTFEITTRTVPSDVRVRITASGGGGSISALMRLTPANAIASLEVDPRRIRGGRSATGTVTLSSPAPAEGRTVLLGASIIDASVPASVTVVSGARSATFTVETRDVSKDTEIWITATVGRDVLEYQIRLTPDRPTSSGLGTVTIGGVVE